MATTTIEEEIQRRVREQMEALQTAMWLAHKAINRRSFIVLAQDPDLESRVQIIYGINMSNAEAKTFLAHAIEQLHEAMKSLDE